MNIQQINPGQQTPTSAQAQPAHRPINIVTIYYEGGVFTSVTHVENRPATLVTRSVPQNGNPLASEDSQRNIRNGIANSSRNQLL